MEFVQKPHMQVSDVRLTPSSYTPAYKTASRSKFHMVSPRQMSEVLLTNIMLRPMPRCLQGFVGSHCTLQAARRDFDLKSPKQVSEVLFNTLKLEPPNNSSRGKSGYYSTSIEVLQVSWMLQSQQLSIKRSRDKGCGSLALQETEHVEKLEAANKALCLLHRRFVGSEGVPGAALDAI
eukprot:1139236-Pelagomonas_calceolata.AAC.5